MIFLAFSLDWCLLPGILALSSGICMARILVPGLNRNDETRILNDGSQRAQVGPPKTIFKGQEFGNATGSFFLTCPGNRPDASKSKQRNVASKQRKGQSLPWPEVRKNGQKKREKNGRREVTIFFCCAFFNLFEYVSNTLCLFKCHLRKKKTKQNKLALRK